MTVKTKIIDSSCLVFPFKRHRPRFLSALQDAGILYGQYSIKRRPPQPNKKRHPKGCLFGGDQPRNPKIKDRRWRSFILFYFVNTTGFVILPRIPQGRERVRGEPLPGSPLAFNHPPAGDHLCTAKVPHQQKRDILLDVSFLLVRAMGLEPTRPYGHKHLKLACLPIPARSRTRYLIIIAKPGSLSSTGGKFACRR